ncbi:Uncharacterised protein [Mycobacteroides abscessus subsp. massiliense]|nr:Uncharacterised protein [Mycobacteroides abscessus subsp. massiliense]
MASPTRLAAAYFGSMSLLVAAEISTHPAGGVKPSSRTAMAVMAARKPPAESPASTMFSGATP